MCRTAIGYRVRRSVITWATVTILVRNSLKSHTPACHAATSRVLGRFIFICPTNWLNGRDKVGCTLISSHAMHTRLVSTGMEAISRLESIDDQQKTCFGGNRTLSGRYYRIAKNRI